MRHATILQASAVALGSRQVQPEEVDRAFGMPLGKLRSRAGIASLRYVADGEDEVELAERCAREALSGSKISPVEIDWVIATSETLQAQPSLAARVHARLGLKECCGALDVGGACLGLLNAFAIAQAMLAGERARCVLVLAADVHSRTLTPDRVSGEFGGLFGDGACAFILRNGSSESSGNYQFGEFVFGCAAQYAGAVQVSDARDGRLAVQFDGEALSRAAISRMEKVIAEVESRSGISRQEVGAFATHQPNPRLVTLLAKQCGVNLDRFAPVARVSGNLGSATCGAALDAALRQAASVSPEQRQPIFLASLGPGLIFGGGWLQRGS